MEMASFKPKGEACNRSFSQALRRNQPCQHLDLGLPASQLWGNKLLLLSHPGRGHFLPYRPWPSKAEGKITRPKNDQRGCDGAGGVWAGHHRKGQRGQKSRAFTLGRKQWIGWKGNLISSQERKTSCTHMEESGLLVLWGSQSWVAQTWLRLAHVCLKTNSPQLGNNSTAGFLYW